MVVRETKLNTLQQLKKHQERKKMVQLDKV